MKESDLVFPAIIHVDVNDQFTYWGHLIVQLGWIVGLLAITFSKTWKSFVALSCAICMIFVRRILFWSDCGADFDLSRAISLDPLIMLFAIMTIRAVVNCEDSTSSSGRQTFIPACLNALLSPGSGIGNARLNKGLSTSAIALMRLASMFTITGNLHSILVLSSAYDQIGWWEYLLDMLLPVGFGFGVAYLLVCLCKLDATDDDSDETIHATCSQEGYEGITLSLKEDEFSSLELKEMESSSDEEENTGDEKKVATVDPLHVQTPDLPLQTPDLIAAGMTVVYAFGGQSTLVTVSGALIFVLLHKLGNWSPEKLLINMEFEPICVYIGVSIITSSVGDVWLIAAPGHSARYLPSYLHSSLLSWECAEQLYKGSGYCLYRTAFTQYLVASICSPVVAVLLFRMVFPYSTPYDWVQISFAVGAAHLLRQVLSSRKRKTPGFVVLILILTLLFLLVGTFLLQSFHVSFECSMKLGECDGV